MKLQHQRSFHVELNYVMGKMEKKLKQPKIIPQFLQTKNWIDSLLIYIIFI